MKKKWMAVLLLVAMMVMFAGCRVTVTEAEPETSKETQTVTSAAEDSPEKTEPQEAASEDLQLGATYSISDMEITFNDVYMTKESQFSTENSSTTYMAFSPADGNSFVVVEAVVKNTGKEDMDVLNNDPFTVVVEFAGEYQYDSDQLRGESPITPLMSATEWCLTEVPDEVVNGTEPLVAYITIGASTYAYTIR